MKLNSSGSGKTSLLARIRQLDKVRRTVDSVVGTLRCHQSLEIISSSLSAPYPRRSLELEQDLAAARRQHPALPSHPMHSSHQLRSEHTSAAAVEAPVVPTNKKAQQEVLAKPWQAVAIYSARSSTSSNSLSRTNSKLSISAESLRILELEGAMP